MEQIAQTFSTYLSIAAEIVAAMIIAIALGRFIYQYSRTLSHARHAHNNAQLRVNFGSTLTLALEILLAADIVITAVAPSWDDIGKLAAIAAIRTALNYFLEKELTANEEREALHTQPKAD